MCAQLELLVTPLALLERTIVAVKIIIKSEPYYGLGSFKWLSRLAAFLVQQQQGKGIPISIKLIIIAILKRLATRIQSP